MRTPNKWIAATLGFLAQPLGMLYVARPGWAAVYLAASVAAAVVVLLGSKQSAVGEVLTPLLGLVCALHAFRLARNASGEGARPWFSRWYGLIASCALLAVPLLLLRAFVVEPFRSPSGAMMPTMNIGDTLFVQKWGYGHYGTFGVALGSRPITGPLERGDIIVFDYPLDPKVQYVKRVVGLPGDTVSCRAGKVSINGADVARQPVAASVAGSTEGKEMAFDEVLDGHAYRILSDPSQTTAPPLHPQFVEKAACVQHADGLECRMPPGTYFVLGDRRDNSSDSRHWGLVPASHVVGKVVHVVQ